VDFLVNNAGISGAEEMVVDMTLEDWNRTMFANLISNYSLIRKYAPRMKANGYGNVLNVSSYFGGEKYVAVAYPNRADYAVSKAGQRVLAEILSRHLGPEIRINALAPGPVDGARLRGLGGAPGLFERRGRLVLENKRLNSVHKAASRPARGRGARKTIMALAKNALHR
jgi:malonyl-CoA reductase/3-hydroxypropionate dehydrogenase (NADP+)